MPGNVGGPNEKLSALFVETGWSPRTLARQINELASHGLTGSRNRDSALAAVTADLAGGVMRRRALLAVSGTALLSAVWAWLDQQATPPTAERPTCLTTKLNCALPAMLGASHASVLREDTAMPTSRRYQPGEVGIGVLAAPCSAQHRFYHSDQRLGSVLPGPTRSAARWRSGTGPPSRPAAVPRAGRSRSRRPAGG